jgi:spore cortex biosynthesis protein YabQ
MGVAVSQQVFALTGALLLGLGLGLVYDLLRVLRSRWHSGGVGAALDLLFWFLAALVLVLWSVYALGGVVRVYIVLAMAAGVWLWFATFSPRFLELGRQIADECAHVAHTLTAPVRALAALWKKFLVFCKKIFSYWLSWYKIGWMFAAAKPRPRRSKAVHREENQLENHKGQPDHEGRHFCFNRLFVHHFTEPAQQDSERKRPLQRSAEPGGDPKRQKRSPGGAHPKQRRQGHRAGNR